MHLANTVFFFRHETVGSRCGYTYSTEYLPLYGVHYRYIPILYEPNCLPTSCPLSHCEKSAKCVLASHLPKSCINTASMYSACKPHQQGAFTGLLMHILYSSGPPCTTNNNWWSYTHSGSRLSLRKKANIPCNCVDLSVRLRSHCRDQAWYIAV